MPKPIHATPAEARAWARNLTRPGVDALPPTQRASDRGHRALTPPEDATILAARALPAEHDRAAAYARLAAGFGVDVRHVALRAWWLGLCPQDCGRRG